MTVGSEKSYRRNGYPKLYCYSSGASPFMGASRQGYRWMVNYAGERAGRELRLSMGTMASSSPPTSPTFRIPDGSSLPEAALKGSTNDVSGGGVAAAPFHRATQEVNGDLGIQEYGPWRYVGNDNQSLQMLDHSEEKGEAISTPNVEVKAGASGASPIIRRPIQTDPLFLVRAFQSYVEGDTDVLGWEVALAALARERSWFPSDSSNKGKARSPEMGRVQSQEKQEQLAPLVEKRPEPPPQTPPLVSPALSGNSSGVPSLAPLTAYAQASYSPKKRRRCESLRMSMWPTARSGSMGPKLAQEDFAHRAEAPARPIILPAPVPAMPTPYISFPSPEALLARPARAGEVTHSVTTRFIPDPLPVCEEDGCLEQASFGLKGSSRVSRCPRHYTGRMTNLLIRRCATERCDRYPPVFGFPGQDALSLVCEFHRKDGMVNTSHSLCQRKGCSTQLSVNAAAAAAARLRQESSVGHAGRDGCVGRNRQIPSFFCEKHSPDGRLKVQERMMPERAVPCGHSSGAMSDSSHHVRAMIPPRGRGMLSDGFQGVWPQISRGMLPNREPSYDSMYARHDSQLGALEIREARRTQPLPPLVEVTISSRPRHPGELGWSGATSRQERL